MQYTGIFDFSIFQIWISTEKGKNGNILVFRDLWQIALLCFLTKQNLNLFMFLMKSPMWAGNQWQNVHRENTEDQHPRRRSCNWQWGDARFANPRYYNRWAKGPKCEQRANCKLPVQFFDISTWARKQKRCSLDVADGGVLAKARGQPPSSLPSNPPPPVWKSMGF